MSTKTLLKSAKDLPLAQRMELCRSLWEDIAASDELTPGEAEEIERRLAEHLKNPDDVVEWNEVRARLDAKYKK